MFRFLIRLKLSCKKLYLAVVDGMIGVVFVLRRRDSSRVEKRLINPPMIVYRFSATHDVAMIAVNQTTTGKSDEIRRTTTTKV